MATVIRKQAMDAYPSEACGVVVDGGYIPCENIHPEPTKAFRIDPGFTSTLLTEGRLQAVLHSHPDGPAHPSVADAQGQIDMGIPWGVVSVIGDIEKGEAHHATEVLWWGDSLPTAPLVGRKFIWHIFHCYQLYRDWWWLHAGIRFPLYACEEEFITNARNIFFECLRKAHHNDLGKIPIEELEIGDMLVGRLRGRHANHCGVYVGNDQILHHPAGGASCTVDLHRWWPYIETVMRHDGTQKPSPLWQPSD